ncbi:MAG: hypothetical protein N2246_11425, partial [Candidatus Sumerlaeia bacterium]|nr:hypothetical protein [Candidatus Sumerlaeia bacterium]
MLREKHIIRVIFSVIILFWVILSVESIAGERQLAKIVVKDSGIYRVTYRDLIQAGVEVKKLDPRKICL